jgi:hypothetical protein
MLPSSRWWQVRGRRHRSAGYRNHIRPLGVCADTPDPDHLLDRVPMSAPVKPFLGLIAAFAGGVAVTVTLIGRPSIEPESVAASKPANIATLENPSRHSDELPATGTQPSSGSNGWVDPVKRSSEAPSTRTSLPPLVFHLDEKADRTKSAASQEGEKVGARQAQRSIVAQVSPPSRPSVSELKAKPEAPSRLILAAKPIERPASSKPSDDLAARKTQSHPLTARLSHKPETARVASNDDAEDDENPAVERQVRRVYVPSRSYGYPAVQPYGRRYVELSDRYEREIVDQPRQYRREATSTQPVGVMRWLVER